ncbi:MAG: Fic family protein [Burkholderiales bacterium]|nr:Fic family protein [Burkholderiales bacterium]
MARCCTAARCQAKSPQLVEQLLDWGKTSEAHPLIKSSPVHYRLEYIHPFATATAESGGCGKR